MNCKAIILTPSNCVTVNMLLVAQILMKLSVYYVTRRLSITGSYHEADESGPLPQILFLYDPLI
jgi:hypothetical protein